MLLIPIFFKFIFILLEPSCPPGQYYNITGDLKCHKCLAGTYSLGGAEEFTSWETLPAAFSLDVGIQSKEIEMQYDTLNKSAAASRCGIEPAVYGKESLTLQSSNCAVILSYAVTLAREGFFTVAYRHTDGQNNLLALQVENSACHRSRDAQKYSHLPSTKSTEWKIANMSLASGRSVVSLWLERAPFASAEVDIIPVYIKNITMSGMAYASQCRKCPPGTYAPTDNSFTCFFCPEGTYQDEEGKKSCKDCGANQFSYMGSKKCTDMKPCKAEDYYSETTGCDAYGKTKLVYKWLTPRRCSLTLPGAVKLPVATDFACPSCNPGQYEETLKADDGSLYKVCKFCPDGKFSNGISSCTECPRSSYSISGIFWRLFRRELPENLVSNRCDGEEGECSSGKGWLSTDTFLGTVPNHGLAAFSILSFKIEEIKRPVKLAIDFEVECDEACLFAIATTVSIVSCTFVITCLFYYLAGW